MKTYFEVVILERKENGDVQGMYEIPTSIVNAAIKKFKITCIEDIEKLIEKK